VSPDAHRPLPAIRDVSVAQLGARMHYAVPRLLEESGRLRRLFTDLCSNSGWPALTRAVPRFLLPGPLRRVRDRRAPGVPARRVTAFPLFGLAYARRRAAAADAAARHELFLWAGREFARRILAGDPRFGRVLYAFNTAALDLFQAARAQGCACVLEQTIAPRALESRLLNEERHAFPGWEAPLPEDAAARALAERERAEWDAADCIVCGSAFVRDGIAACGGPADRCRVVPYGVALAGSGPGPRPPHDGPLRVLTVGAVGLRKGSPYVLQAAARLRGRAVFRLVGTVTTPAAAAAAQEAGAQLTGPVPRLDMPRQYAWADVFLLPSLCEGSATVTYEAMGAGLPVVCTPNTGSVVRDGIDGLLVPARDTEAIVAALGRLLDEPGLLAGLAGAAAARRGDISLDGYARRLLPLFEDDGSNA
jgi:glycosyltransferase involved in cell wall biosynthesis